MKKTIRVLSTALFAASMLATTQAVARIINIPDDYATIQGGINAAEGGDTVLVAEGRYVENLQIEMVGIVLASRYLLSGDQADIDSTILLCGEDDVYTVVMLYGEGQTALLSGMTFGSAHEEEGGGLDIHDYNATIDHCVFRNIRGRFAHPALLYVGPGVVSVTYCVFDSNECYLAGGAIAAWSSLSVDHCLFPTTVPEIVAEPFSLLRGLIQWQ